MYSDVSYFLDQGESILIISFGSNRYHFKVISKEEDSSDQPNSLLNGVFFLDFGCLRFIVIQVYVYQV